jgi:cobalt/nickel transport protein
MKKWTVIILVVVAALVIVPLAVHPAKAKFGGADTNAQSAIKSIDPGYKPWFKSIYTPPSTEIQSLLFALQAAAGAGMLFFALGYFVGRAKGRKQAGSTGDAATPAGAGPAAGRAEAIVGHTEAAR